MRQCGQLVWQELLMRQHGQLVWQGLLLNLHPKHPPRYHQGQGSFAMLGQGLHHPSLVVDLRVSFPDGLGNLDTTHQGRDRGMGDDGLGTLASLLSKPIRLSQGRTKSVRTSTQCHGALCPRQR